MGARIAVYLIKKVGMFPDISEELSQGHLAKGDVVSCHTMNQHAKHGHV